MAEIPDNLRYTKDHEWVKPESGNIVSVGVTDYAQESLGDIVYVELPSEGEQVTKEDTFGVVESVKAVSDCYVPVSGKIVEINDTLADSPETVNEDCYGEGWLIKIEMSDPAELSGLMTHEQYEAYVAEEAHS